MIYWQEIRIEDFERYEVIRSSGAYDMSDPQAIRDSGLSEEKFKVIQRNYTELCKKYPQVRKI